MAASNNIINNRYVTATAKMIRHSDEALATSQPPNRAVTKKTERSKELSSLLSVLTFIVISEAPVYFP